MDPDALQAKATICTRKVRRQLERSRTTQRGPTSAVQIGKSKCSGSPFAWRRGGGQRRGVGQYHVLCNSNLTRILERATHVRTKKARRKGRALRNEMKVQQNLLRAWRVEL